MYDLAYSIDQNEKFDEGKKRASWREYEDEINDEWFLKNNNDKQKQILTKD